MEVLEFRKITIDDEYNDKYNDGYAWSRVYEYQLVLNSIKKYYPDNTDITMHNTSWGFTGVHVLFKDELDKVYANTTHSDIKPSSLPKTMVLDITQAPLSKLVEAFDVVINVSTLEEINNDHVGIFNNLLAQVKVGGLLICTFDLPGLQLDKFESMFTQKLITSEHDLSNHNSKLKNLGPSILECGLMIIKK